MKKLLISVAAVVTVGALILTGCPDGNTGGNANGDGNGNGNAARCATPGSAAIDVVYGDATYTGGVQLDLSATDAFGNGTGGENAMTTGDAMVDFAEIDGGAASSTKAYRLSLTTSTDTTKPETYAIGFITLNETYNASGKTLKFSVKSPSTGGHNKIRVYFQDGSYTAGDPLSYQTGQDDGIVSFTNDDMWEEVSVDIDATYTATNSGTNFMACNVNVIGFAMEDANGDTAGLGTQTIEIDEVRFE